MTFLAPAIGDLSDALRRFPLWVALGNIERGRKKFAECAKAAL